MKLQLNEEEMARFAVHRYQFAGVDIRPRLARHYPLREMGVHAIGYGRHFQVLGSNSSGVEAYASGRFFTVTEQTIQDSGIICLADHVKMVLAPIHRAASGRATNAAAREVDAIAQVSPQAVADLRSALEHRGLHYNPGSWVNRKKGRVGRGPLLA